MITKLTKTQEKAIPRYIKRYIAFATKPTNRKKATKAVYDIYKEMGEEKPIVIFGQSPLSTEIMAATFFCIVKDKKSLTQLNSQLNSQLYSHLNSQLYSQLNSQLDSQLNSQLKKIKDDWYLSIWRLSWVAWYMYGKYVGVNFDEKRLKLLSNFVTNVSFIVPYKGIAFVSETPKEIHWKNKMLHNDSKPAVLYKDGYSLYSINGVRVNKKIVETPEKLTKKDWLDEKNLETRRIIQERMPDFAEKIGGKSLEYVKGKSQYELFEIDITPDPEKIAHYLKMKDHSTDRWYYLRTPPTLNTVAESLAWTFSMDVKSYAPQIES